LHTDNTMPTNVCASRVNVPNIEKPGHWRYGDQQMPRLFMPCLFYSIITISELHTN